MIRARALASLLAVGACAAAPAPAAADDEEPAPGSGGTRGHDAGARAMGGATGDAALAVPDGPAPIDAHPIDSAPEPPDATGAEPVATDAAAPDATTGAFQNGLGMRFVPVPGTQVLVSIWETRVQDYQAYADATGAAIPHPDFAETALQPKAAVSRAQAQAFAAWLTQTEQDRGALAPGQRYRLPTDAEWDAAIAVGLTGGPFPWGGDFPPPARFANYGLGDDGFATTAPVGSFPPNRYGLYDLAGNLWEWIGEGCARGGGYLVRGAGWNARGQSYMESAFHYCFGADLVGHHNVGFRLVLAGS
jgi:hypothetical protein